MKDDKYYKSLDKRSKEYKEWKKKEQITGLGDVVHKVAKAVGIDKVVKAFTPEGKDCGCDDRKQKLNAMFPIRQPAVRCLTQSQHDQYAKFVESRTLDKIIEREHAKLLIDLTAWVFATQHNINDFGSNCGGCGKKLLKMVKKLDEVYYSYER